ncbi:MAG: M48 family metalloprotease [Alphaproteobacteria bacterium]|nr:M48 family metalloprotease [Alphaproteobacteria bacterium]
MFKRLFLFSILLILLGACSTNPATGEKQFTAFMNTAQEKQIGAEEHRKVLTEYTLYDDKRLQKYVSEIGKKVTANTERPDVQYQFHLLDSPVVNAFALPGGYIYVTRGILALACSEAEVAAVLAHEAGHVTARHSAERYSRSVVTSIGTTILSVAIDSTGVSQALSVGSDLYLKSYSRDQENQADALALRYLNYSGYNMLAMSDFLSRLQAQSALEKKMAGDNKSSDAMNSLFSTHPATAARVNKTRIQAQGLGGANNGAVGRDAYLRVIDGIFYGDSAAQGFIRGNNFVHPELGLMFSVPEDYKLYNSSSQVVAKGKGSSSGSMIIFDLEGNAERASPMRFLRDIWLKGQNVESAEEIIIGGMKATTASIEGNVSGKSTKIQLIAVQWAEDKIARFQVILPSYPTKAQLDALKKATYSFRRMSEADYNIYGPYRIRIITAHSGDNVSSLVKRMAVDEYKEERFRLLNGMSAEEAVKVGGLYKIVARY